MNVAPHDRRYPVVSPMGCLWSGQNLVVVEDEEDEYATVEVKNETVTIKECLVSRSDIVKPKPEWFKPKQDNESI